MSFWYILGMIFTKKNLSILLSLVLIFVSFAFYFPVRANAALASASVIMGDPRASTTNVTYTVGFTFGGVTPIQCIQIKFATSSTMATPATGMTSGSGFTLSGGGLTQANFSNYGVTNGTLQIDAATNQTPTATATTITFTGVTNTSLSSEFAQVTTYSTNTSHTCSGVVDQSNIMALITTTGVTASVTVDPTLTFNVSNYGSAVNGSGSTGLVTTTNTTVPFGTVAAGSTAAGSQSLAVSTNAAHGYNLYVRDTQPLTNSNLDTIADTTGTNASPVALTANTFGYTTDGAGATQFTSNTWAKLDTTNRIIATRATPQNADTTHVEYKVGISNVQQPGTYSTIITYTVAPTY
jgi:hypothetical protein